MCTLTSLYHPTTREQLDKGMYVWFPKPNSFTGEDVLELHIHGGRAVIHDTLEAISACDGTRMAEPGEFTKRAFDNDKMDLTEVEGLADLLEAQTHHQRKVALSQMQGSISRFYLQLREDLIRASAYMEAFIDFGDDAEIDPEVVEQSRRRIINLRDRIIQHLNDGKRGERLRDGAVITIIGPPNAGKSSLINLLARRKASIVSPIPGTTRDIIEVMLDVGGYPVVIGDTAGIRVSQDVIEQEGVEMAKERLHRSDIKLCVLDCNTLMEMKTPDALDPLLLQLVDPGTLFIFNKTDLIQSSTSSQWTRTKQSIIQQLEQHFKSNTHLHDHISIPPINSIELSCSKQEGINQLLKQLEISLREMFEIKDVEAPLLTRLRHKEHLTNCVESLDRYLYHCDDDIVLASEELRSAIKSIGSISHHVNVDDLLDVIFKDFCIGK
ncbi:hypothetical protein SAMD00019534_106670 [Acytostelium subglobosum LB1]|uniref:hypothetical protein n=1 Tax=Acytostelium subglobosum LB1 TaxID=1410327 RepID=UPI000644ACB0|nr:hypothetical protein SAMD00019534_106670 [Acytostelium subglobosum LB1]GAM27491.1 hypothetical protein SAMD00019534_106670 [Acytostelium subglobosum LB1]|eukprot:XP_012749556.1 hypothetical protein SAMD00019534_106670 [Acytostelium subglobosum LB1]